MNHVVFKIKITPNYHLQIFIITEENKEIKVKLLSEENNKEEYSLCISFSSNSISICNEENQNSIYFMKDWIENPDN